MEGEDRKIKGSLKEAKRRREREKGLHKLPTRCGALIHDLISGDELCSICRLLFYHGGNGHASNGYK